MNTAIQEHTHPISLIIAPGNMVSVALPIAKQMRSIGFSPVFAVRRNSTTYGEFLKGKTPFDINLIDTANRPISRYRLNPFGSFWEASRSQSVSELPIAPIDSISSLSGISCIFISVGTVVNDVFSQLSLLSDNLKHIVPVFLLENLSDSKKKVFESATGGMIVPKNAVIHRTSRNLTVTNDEITITTDTSGYVKLSQTEAFNDLNVVVDNVSITSLNSEELSFSEKFKWVTTNLVDYIIGRIVELDALQKGNIATGCMGTFFSHELIKSRINPALEFIASIFTDDIDVRQTVFSRIAMMQTDYFIRILKSKIASGSMSEYDAKLLFYHEQALSFLPSRRELLSHGAELHLLTGQQIVFETLELSVDQ